MKIYISDGQNIVLPVNPEEIKISSASSAVISEVINLGQVTELTIPELATFSFSCFWPASKNVPYLETKDFISPDNFVKRIETSRQKKKPVRFIVTGTKINKEVVIENFEWGYSGASKDIEYTIEFKEYRKAKAKYLQNTNKNVHSQQPSRPAASREKKQNLTVGATVIVNGRLHRDSAGNGPGLTEKNATRKISHIAKGKKYPIHIVTIEGGWRGWVAEASVTLK